jgi:hypothetical protein
MELASHNYLRVTTLPQVTLDEYPIFTNGFRYSDFSYDYAWRSGKYTPGSYDYNALIRQFDLARRVDSGDVDEVWVQGVPGFQMWETSMAGPNGYWCNSNPIPGRNGTRLFIVTGFNYERGLAEMIHDWGHRTESIMGSKVHHAWNASGGSTHWDHFSRYEQIAPGRASCGNDHYPPNANADYEYSNTNFVWSDADDWFNFPNFTGARTYINREAWSGPFPGDYQRSYFNWWFSRMPHIPGTTLDPGIREQRLMNWWKYIVDMNAQPESR